MKNSSGRLLFFHGLLFYFPSIRELPLCLTAVFSLLHGALLIGSKQNRTFFCANKKFARNGEKEETLGGIYI
jgi:hypothetical protein